VAVEADGSPADDINGVDGADTDTIVDDGNCFIGTALVRSTLTPFSGGAYGAEAFRKLTDAAVDAGVGGTAAILLNGTLYDAAPTQFSAQIRTPVIASNNLDQIITLASVSGDLAGGGMSTVTTSGMGVIYRADEATASTPVTLAGTCQVGNEVRAALRPVGPIPPGTNRLYGFLNGTTALGIGTGYGYVKFNTTPAVGLLRITETTVTNATIWSGITTLHKTALGAATLTVPVFPPFCEFF